MAQDGGFDRARQAAEAAAPVLWLVGKTQSGKTSLIAELTGEGHDDVGHGFRPATRQSRLYSFPPEMPVVRFLDTRGLEDAAAYDPAEDIAYAEQQAHVVVAVVRAEDLSPDPVLGPVRAARRRHPDWPLIVVQTRLHDLYPPGGRHPLPYPFDGTAADAQRPGLPDDLRRAIAAQRRLFEGLPGPAPVFVPLDFTRPEDGFAPANYGAERLWAVLREVLPGTIAGAGFAGDRDSRIRWQVVLPWSTAAAAADAVPLPVVGGIASAGLQGAMVHAISGRFGLDWDSGLWAKFAAMLGPAFAAGYAAKWAVRQVLKLVPVAGAAAVAAWSFAVTWGIGEAAIYFCRELRAGREPDPAELRRRYRKAFAQAEAIWASRQRTPSAA